MENTLTQPTLEAAPTAHAHHAHACLNCGRGLHEQFCAHCGQNAHTHRFTLRHLLLHDLPHAVWHVDKGLLYTLRAMLTQPGRAIDEYLAGRRVRHFHPLTYMLLLAGVTGLVFSALHLDPYAGVQQMPRLQLLIMERYMAGVLKYPAAMYILLLPLNALLMKWLLRPTRYNYAEMLVGQAFISGTLSLVSLLVMTLLILLFGGTGQLPKVSMLVLPVALVYPTWVYLQMLAPVSISTAARWVRALSTAALQMMAMFVVALGYMAYLLVVLVKQDPSLLKEFQAQAKAKQTVTLPAPQH